MGRQAQATAVGVAGFVAAFVVVYVLGQLLAGLIIVLAAIGAGGSGRAGLLQPHPGSAPLATPVALSG